MDGRNTLRVDAYFFEHGEKISVFQKYPDTCGLGLNSSVKFIMSIRKRLIDSPVRFLFLRSMSGERILILGSRATKAVTYFVVRRCCTFFQRHPELRHVDYAHLNHA